MEKVKEIFSPHERREDEDQLYGENAAGTQPAVQDGQPAPDTPTVKNPLAQGHVHGQEPSSAIDGEIPSISAPADVTGMTGQYVIGRDTSPILEQERKKHGTAVGLASATMASGAVGDQSPSN